MHWGHPIDREAQRAICGQTSLEPLITATPASAPREKGPEIQNKRTLRANPVQIKETGMSDEFTAADTFERGSSNEESPVDRAAETIRSASHGVSDAIDVGREPDMPLDILTKIFREAPLPSLAIAFLLGVLVARR
jgi:hypothetical protein